MRCRREIKVFLLLENQTIKRNTHLEIDIFSLQKYVLYIPTLILLFIPDKSWCPFGMKRCEQRSMPSLANNLHNVKLQHWLDSGNVIFFIPPYVALIWILQYFDKSCESIMYNDVNDAINYDVINADVITSLRLRLATPKHKQQTSSADDNLQWRIQQKAWNNYRTC